MSDPDIQNTILDKDIVRAALKDAEIGRNDQSVEVKE